MILVPIFNVKSVLYSSGYSSEIYGKINMFFWSGGLFIGNLLSYSNPKECGAQMWDSIHTFILYTVIVRKRAVVIFNYTLVYKIPHFHILIIYFVI